MSNGHPFGISSADDLYGRFEKYCQEESAVVLLSIQLSRQRINDAFEAWEEDSKRNAVRNMDGGAIPDHIKDAAILTYWLRRERPVIDVLTTKTMYAEFGVFFAENPDGNLVQKMDEAQMKARSLSSGISPILFLAHRKRLQAYANEYLSFDFGFRLAREFELIKRKETNNDAVMKTPTPQFIDDFCYFLKFKSVSPHAVYFVYRSLLSS